MARLTESLIELAALGGLQALGDYGLANGPELAPGEPASGRSSYIEVTLADRLRDALARLNRGLPAGEVEQVVRILSRPPIRLSSRTTAGSTPCSPTASRWSTATPRAARPAVGERG